MYKPIINIESNPLESLSIKKKLLTITIIIDISSANKNCLIFFLFLPYFFHFLTTGAVEPKL
jgi:hypothetical protein